MSETSDRVAAAVWPWRETGDDARSAAQRDGQARRQGLWRAVIGLIAAVLVYHFWNPAAGLVVGAIATGVLLSALFSPLGVYRRLDGWLAKLTHAVGLAVTWLLMPLLYYLVFLPMGLLLRARGRLRLIRRPDPEAASYWMPRGGDGTGTHDYRRQF